MKKRLLALALCLVLMTSLLPLTAAAETPTKTFKSLYLRGSVEYNDNYGGTYFVNLFDSQLVTKEESDESDGITSTPIRSAQTNSPPITSSPVAGETYYVSFSKQYYGESFSVEWDQSFSAKLEIPGYTTEFIEYYFQNITSPQVGFRFRLTKEREHLWQFTQTENSLTATCGNSGCPIGKASLTLDAHSVTLPESPFNAQVILNGITEEQIKEEFRYEISPIRYKFKAPGDSAFTEITPADGAREGTYQAAVTLSPISTTFSARSTADPNSVTLYTQYTAVNPETTAQTGDNRPIEIMLASAAVFSALAAAAFALDSKRRSQQ